MLLSEITTHNVEVIVHCAAQPSHDWACSAPLIDLNINLLGTVNLLRKPSSSRLPRFVYLFKY